MNVLVIEDSEDMRFLMSEYLPMSAPIAEIQCAANEDEALVALSGFHPDVVILDSCTGGPAPEHTAQVVRSMHSDVHIISFSGLPSIDGAWADAIVRKTADGMTMLADVLKKLAAA